MCTGGGGSPAPPPLPPAAAPPPTPADPAVVKARSDERQRAMLAGGRGSTILNLGGAQGLSTQNPNGKKTLLGS